MSSGPVAVTRSCQANSIRKHVGHPRLTAETVPFLVKSHLCLGTLAPYRFVQIEKQRSPIAAFVVESVGKCKTALLNRE